MIGILIVIFVLWLIQLGSLYYISKKEKEENTTASSISALNDTLPKNKGP